MLEEKLIGMSNDIMDTRHEVAQLGLESVDGAIANTFLNLSSLYLKKVIKIISK